MRTPVSLKEIAETFELDTDQFLSFVNMETGEVCSVTRDLLSAVEDSENPEEEVDYLTWQKDEFEDCCRIVNSDHFIQLPDKDDVNEWDIMRDFAEEVSRPFATLCCKQYMAHVRSATLRTQFAAIGSRRTGTHIATRLCVKLPRTGAKVTNYRGVSNHLESVHPTSGARTTPVKHSPTTMSSAHRSVIASATIPMSGGPTNRPK